MGTANKKTESKADSNLPSKVVRRRFAIEYVRDFNPIFALARTMDITRSDIENDPSLKEQANLLPHDPFTNDHIETQLGYLQDKTEVDREFLILKTRQVLDQCMKATPVMEKVRGQFVESGEFEFDSLGAIKAIQTLYDITGIKHEKVEESDDKKTGVMMVPEAVTPDDWAVVVAKTRDLQDSSLERILEDFNPGDEAKPN